jgi:hypothetical protein
MEMDDMAKRMGYFQFGAGIRRMRLCDNWKLRLRPERFTLVPTSAVAGTATHSSSVFRTIS